MGTIVGMGLGGWMSGEIFDLTQSYKLAFVNGTKSKTSTAPLQRGFDDANDPSPPSW